MTAAVLALLASFSWGTSDFLAGLESRRSTAWTAALGGQLVASLSLIALLVATAPDRPGCRLAAPLVGGAIGGLGVLLQYRALALVDMSVVSPIIAGAALVPVLWGIGAGERPSPAAGRSASALAVAGIVLISRASAGRECRRRSRHMGRAGILVAVVAAIAFGLFLVASTTAAPTPYWTVARTTAVLTSSPRPPRHPAGHPVATRAVPALLVIGLLIAAANILFTSATTSASASSPCWAG